MVVFGVQTWACACAPVYQCFCGICRRRVAQAPATDESAAATQEQVSAPELVPPVSVPQEVQMELVRAEEEESLDDEDEEDDDEDGESELETSEYEVVTPRKRPSLVMLDGGADADATMDAGHRGPSPPKRARVDGTYSPSMVSMSPGSGGMRKRPSEELDEDSDSARGNGEHKRSRTESHPRSMSASAEVAA